MLAAILTVLKQEDRAMGIDEIAMIVGLTVDETKKAIKHYGAQGKVFDIGNGTYRLVK